jgi:hypothetical protein
MAATTLSYGQLPPGARTVQGSLRPQALYNKALTMPDGAERREGSL